MTYAKEVATLDNLSGGRLQLGIGIGWLKEEFEVLGVPWERRAARTEEYVEVMRALWAADNASFDGEFVTFDGMSSNPKPANGSVPITIGGHSRAAAERAGRMGNGFFPAKGDMAELAEIARTTAEEHGRDGAALDITGIHPGLFGEDMAGAVEEAAAGPRPSGRALVHVLPEPRGVDRSDGRRSPRSSTDAPSVRRTAQRAGVIPVRKQRAAL